jgi:hypothetical protein
MRRLKVKSKKTKNKKNNKVHNATGVESAQVEKVDAVASISIPSYVCTFACGALVESR